MTHRSIMVLGVLVPTASAALFEWGLLYTREVRPSIEEAVGRIALMFLAALFFTAFMFALFQRHRRDVERQLRRFDDLFQNTHQGIILVDKYRQITASNPYAKSLLDISGDIPTRPLCRLCCLPAGERCLGNCPVLDRDNGTVFRINLRKSNGAITGVMMCVSHIPGDKNTPGETVLRFNELSELESREQARASRLVTRKILEAREEERRHLARELHDGIGQELYALRLAAQARQPVDQMAQQLMEEVDNLAKQLWPPVLDRLGLEKALEEAFQPHSIVTVEAEGMLSSLPVPLKAALYRIAQEAVTNALKHSNASEVEVRLYQRDSDTFLTVKDNGIGFSPTSERNLSNLGLASMRERAELAQGVFTLSSTPGKGTTVEECLPLLKETDATV